MKTAKLLMHYQFLNELTNEQVAEQLGVTPQAVYLWKKGSRKTPEMLHILLSLLLK